MNITILGIESSCDDTAAAVYENGYILSSVISNQEVHKQYGGVVPELASRAHQQNIIPVVDEALRIAGKSKDDISAVAFTKGPGLIGALLVGTSFAKGFALAQKIPIIEVNHLHAHILSLFIRDKDTSKILPMFPFLCLLVSGGHTQIVLVNNYLELEIIGQTIDDAAGEAFDKCAKILGLPYPGGPLIDQLAKNGNPSAFVFNKPRIDKLNYSFSGLKTSFLYFLRDRLKADSNFISNNLEDLCASIQNSIIEVLMEKFILAAKENNIDEIGLAGGVSANTGLRNELIQIGKANNWIFHFPEFKYSTDNAAMIAITGYYKYLNREFCDFGVTPEARLKF